MVPLEVAAVCWFFVLFWHRFLTAKARIKSPTEFQFLEFISAQFCVSGLSFYAQPLIGSVEIRSLSDWSFFVCVNRSSGSGQPPAGCVTHADSSAADTSGAEELPALQTQRLQST